MLRNRIDPEETFPVCGVYVKSVSEEEIFCCPFSEMERTAGLEEVLEPERAPEPDGTCGLEGVPERERVSELNVDPVQKVVFVRMEWMSGCSGGIVLRDAKEHRMVYCSDNPKTVQQLTRRRLPVTYLEREGAAPFYGADWVWQCTEEATWPDEAFLEKVWRRTLHFPWIICRTDRLLIRESVPEDLEAFLRFYEEEQENPDVGSWSGNPMEQLCRYIEGQYPAFGYGLWTVILLETGEIIGRAGLEQPGTQIDDIRERRLEARSGEPSDINDQKIPADDCLELSWLIGRRYRRKGYALEAAKAILQYAGEELECRHIMVRTSAGNEASIALAQKLGSQVKLSVFCR